MDLKIISKEDFFKGLNYSFSIDAIKYLISKYHLSYGESKEYLTYIPYVESDFNNAKIRKIFGFQQELLKKQLITKNPYFEYEIKKSNIIVVNYSKDDYQLLTSLDKLMIKPVFMELKSSNFIRSIYEFKTPFDELYYVFNQICKLIKKGINTNDIYICNLSEEYEFDFKTMQSFFNLPIDEGYDKPIYCLPVCGDFLSKFTKDVSPLQLIKDYSNNNEIYDIMREIINDYYIEDLSYEEQKQLYIDVFKSTKKVSSRFKNSIQLLNRPFYKKDGHLFIVNFSQESIPSFKKDVDYLNDNEKEILGLNSSKIQNKIEKDLMANLLKSDMNIHLSYMTNSFNQKHSASSLSSELGYKIIKEEIINDHFSKRAFVVEKSRIVDDYDLYKDLSLKYKMYRDVFPLNFKSYHPRYNHVEALKENDSLSYSYSSLKLFYGCKFVYYLCKVLKIDEFQDSFGTKYGSLVHMILEQYLKPDFDFDSVYDKAIKSIQLSSLEKIMISKLIVDLKEYLKFLDYQMSLYVENKRPVIATEIPLQVTLNDRVSLNGRVDKTFLFDNKYLVLIDYKTSSQAEDFKSSQLDYGFSLQLPFYAFLCKHDNKYQDKELIGLYIANTFINSLPRPSFETNKDYYFNYFKYRGISLNEQEKISYFDPSYKKSDLIVGMRINNDGQLAKSRANSKSEIDNYSKTIHDLVLKADEDIRHNNFDIDPKIIDKVNTCKYCNFKDVCFSAKKEHIIIDSKAEEEEENE